MSVPAMAAAPALVDGTGAGTLDAELLERAARDDYHEWLSGAKAAGGCIRPIRLRGTIRNVDAVTGEILSALDTEDSPDKVIYLPCGDRRASVCPSCAATYRSDTYQLIRAGLAGGKGLPASVATHPCVFVTFTAPSFGPVHTRVVTSGGKVAQCGRGARRTSARMGAGSPAGSGTGKTMPASASLCARTATTTTPPWCGTSTRPSCGAAPSSPSGAAWTSSPRHRASAFGSRLRRWPSFSAAG
jgi:hypothetical protein